MSKTGVYWAGFGSGIAFAIFATWLVLFVLLDDTPKDLPTAGQR